MHCTNHPKTESTGACVECGKLFCENCIIKVGRKRYCKECASEILKVDGESGNSTLNKFSHKGIVITQQTTNIQTPSNRQEPIETHLDKEKIEKGFRYGFSFLFLIFSFAALDENKTISFVFLILFAVISFPPFENWLKDKTKIKIPMWLLIALFILSLILLSAPR